MALKNLFDMVKADRYTQDGREALIKAQEEETEDKVYQIGEISQKTGLQKTANGWVKPKSGKQPGAKKPAGNHPPKVMPEGMNPAEFMKAWEDDAKKNGFKKGQGNEWREHLRNEEKKTAEYKPSRRVDPKKQPQVSNPNVLGMTSSGAKKRFEALGGEFLENKDGVDIFKTRDGDLVEVHYGDNKKVLRTQTTPADSVNLTTVRQGPNTKTLNETPAQHVQKNLDAYKGYQPYDMEELVLKPSGYEKQTSARVPGGGQSITYTKNGAEDITLFFDKHGELENADVAAGSKPAAPRREAVSAGRMMKDLDGNFWSRPEDFKEDITSRGWDVDEMTNEYAVISNEAGSQYEVRFDDHSDDGDLTVRNFKALQIDEDDDDDSLEDAAPTLSEIVDRVYNIGEISEKTGLQKTAQGWKPPKETKFGKVKQNKEGQWGVQTKQGKGSDFLKHKSEKEASRALANYTAGYNTTERSKQDPHSDQARQVKHWDKETEKIRKQNRAEGRAAHAAQFQNPAGKTPSRADKEAAIRKDLGLRGENDLDRFTDEQIEKMYAKTQQTPEQQKADFDKSKIGQAVNKGRQEFAAEKTRQKELASKTNAIGLPKQNKPSADWKETPSGRTNMIRTPEGTATVTWNKEANGEEWYGFSTVKNNKMESSDTHYKTKAEAQLAAEKELKGENKPAAGNNLPDIPDFKGMESGDYDNKLRAEGWTTGGWEGNGIHASAIFKKGDRTIRVNEGQPGKITSVQEISKPAAQDSAPRVLTGDTRIRVRKS